MSKRREKWDQRYRDKSDAAPGMPGFLLPWLTKLQDGRLLDLASGDGSIALNLPDRFEVCAVDFSEVALQRLEQFAVQKALVVETIQTDLESTEALLSLGRFQSVIICRYKPSETLLLQLPQILLPGGSLIIATFNNLHHQKNGFPERLTLQPDELSTIDGLNLIEYQNGTESGDSIDVYLFQKPGH
ncbi:MAG: class I SAM-dependent methyltransferase [Amphritea sp.]|nr:class I SAM-dependent methyltransferase [Amphritea sp.]